MNNDDDEFASAAPPPRDGEDGRVPRDDKDRPKVLPPDGKALRSYTRATTWAKALDDNYNLALWQQRMVAIGLAQRPALLTAVGSHIPDADTYAGKKEINAVCSQAQEAAGAYDKARRGTALHKFCQDHDEGKDVFKNAPGDSLDDLRAYVRTTSGLKYAAIEQFRVLDDLKIGGTADRIIDNGDEFVVGDIKTGSIDFSTGAIAIQLAIYAHAVAYKHPGIRIPDEKPMNLERALIIHLPAGEAKCELWWVDIVAGWKAVMLAGHVRAWRSRKDLKWPMDTLSAGELADAAVAEMTQPASLFDEIQAITDVQKLRTWYAAQAMAGYASDDILAACKVRAEQLKAAG